MLRRVGGWSLPKKPEGVSGKDGGDRETGSRDWSWAFKALLPVCLVLSHFYESGKKSDTVQTSPLSLVPCPQNFTICLAAPDKEPDMFLFSECRAPNQNEHVKLGCMAIGVQPLTLTWEPTFPSIVFSVTNKNYYITILQVSVPASDLNLNHICTITNTSKKKSKKFTLPGEYP